MSGLRSSRQWLSRRLGKRSGAPTTDHAGDLYREGRLADAVAAAERAFTEDPNDARAFALRHFRGLARAIDTRFCPSIPGPPEPLPPSERIAHLFKVVYPFESTGGSIRNLNTISSQAQAGLDPYVITPVHYPRKHGLDDFPLTQNVAGVPHFHFDFDAKTSRELNCFDRLIELDTLMSASVIRAQGAGLVHAASGFHGFELALKGLALRDHFDIPLIYEVRSFHEHTWTPDSKVGEKSEYTRARIAQENRCMAEADWVVTISETMRHALVERGVDSHSITVVPNAIDPEKFPPTEVLSRGLRDQFCRSDATLVGYISNMSRREGHDVLIRALGELSEQTHCLFVGDGRERKKLESLAAELGVARRVHFTGVVDHAEINYYYQAIDIFVVPRRKDTAADLVTPLKPFEAMALGVPLIVSDRPALREIVGSDRGEVFRSEDHADLARTIDELARSPERRRELSQRAKAWVFAERTWTTNAARYVDLYAEVKARYRRPR